jgi:phosphatidylglycerophosphate synthase
MTARAGLRAIPSIISSSRVLLAAGFVAVNTVDARLGLVAVAAFTDVLDGWIARRAKWTSRWGALIDPIADRVFSLVAVSTFLFSGVLTTVGYFVMISRDLMTAVGFLVTRMIPWVAKVPFKARASGKLVTTLQIITFVALLRFPAWIPACLWAVGLASVYSITDYTYALWRARTA